MKRWRVPVLFVSLGWLWSASAGQVQDAPILKWDAVAARAMVGPAALAAQARFRAAQAGVSEARQYPNPEFTLRRGRSDDLNGAGPAAVWGIEVGLPLESVRLRAYRQRLAATGVEIARWEEEVVRLEVLRELRLLYLAVAHDQALAASYAASLDHLARLVEGVRMRVTQGEARPIELVRLEGEQAEAQAEAQAVAADAAANRQRLALWLGPDGPTDFRVVPDLEPLPPLPPLAQVSTRLRASHPLLKAARTSVQQAEAQVGVARQAVLPGVLLGGAYDREAGAPTYTGMLTVAVPLWNWNRGGVAVARAERQRAVHGVELLERQLEEEAIRLHGKATGAHLAVAQYTARILPNSGAVLAAVERSYRAGETSLLDLLDARRQAVRTRVAYLGLLAEYRSLWTELNTLTGGMSND